MNRNFLKVVTGVEMNVLLSAAAINFKRVMNLWKQRLINFILKIVFETHELSLSKYCFIIKA